MHLISLCLIFFFSSGAWAVLYENDHETRTESTVEELAAVINFRNTLFFIDDNIAVTTAHTAVDGMLMINNSIGITVEKVLDESETANGGIDYKILKVDWVKLEGRAFKSIPCPKGTRLLNILTDLDLIQLARPSGSTVIITESIKAIGFPKDRQTATTARGDKLLFLADSKLAEPIYEVLFNAGVTRGNSGGPILDSKDRLIGIVTGGPDNGTQSVYDSKKVLDFNYGLSANALYKLSAPFREVIDRAKSHPKGQCK